MHTVLQQRVRESERFRVLYHFVAVSDHAEHPAVLIPDVSLISGNHFIVLCQYGFQGSGQNGLKGNAELN